jgi:quercetin dioxygenase-like cupin family protein
MDAAIPSFAHQGHAKERSMTFLSRIPRKSVRTEIEQLEILRLGTFENATYELVELHGGRCHPPHTHLKSDATLHIVFGKGVILLDGKSHAFAAGRTFEVPRGTSHGFRVEEDTLMLSIQNPPIVNFDTREIDVVYDQSA